MYSFQLCFCLLYNSLFITLTCRRRLSLICFARIIFSDSRNVFPRSKNQSHDFKEGTNLMSVFQPQVCRCCSSVLIVHLEQVFATNKLVNGKHFTKLDGSFIFNVNPATQNLSNASKIRSIQIIQPLCTISLLKYPQQVVLDIQLYKLVARICKNFEQNKPLWYWRSRRKQY